VIADPLHYNFYKSRFLSICSSYKLSRKEQPWRLVLWSSSLI
jgi:hypothetical protein